MAPNTNDTTGILFEEESSGFKTIEAKKLLKADDRKPVLVWRNIMIFSYLHLMAVYGIYLWFSGQTMWQTILFSALTSTGTGLSVTAGCHRLWSHKSYKAKLPLRILLTFFNTVGFQGSVIGWARDHRMHHKYTDTDADPHNATRGFFFSHVGWLLCRKHPELRAKSHLIDMSDLEADPVLHFQKKYYLYLMPLMSFILPAVIPVYFWGESLWVAWHVSVCYRYTQSLNFTWLVNSAAHIYGTKPYDKHINPTENSLVSFLALGEGWHNFHHSFPWDYSTGEYSGYSTNLTKIFIDAMAKIGWAYDLKTASKEVIHMRAKRTGDGSYPHWGWDDYEKSQKDANTVKSE